MSVFNTERDIFSILKMYDKSVTYCCTLIVNVLEILYTFSAK